MADGERRAALEAAYRATAYVCALPGGPLVLRVDQPAPDATRPVLAGRAAVVTAANPRSEQHGCETNAAANARLHAELDAAGFESCASEARAAGDWPAEAGYLVLGIGEADAERLATRFDQYAYLFVDTSGTPRLRFTPHW